MAFGFGFGMPRSFAAPAFTPLSLFTTGVQGAWYDPSDRSTLFQDAAGTTPVTAVEQPVGLMLDKSKGLVLGPELVTNGNFSSNTWWTLTGTVAISSGSLNFTSALATSGAYRLSFATVGKYYELTFEITSISSGGVQIGLGDSKGTNRTSVGIYTQRLLCTGNSNLTLYSVGASTTASVDNVSIKELSGNHAFQTTAASRPVLSARYNLLTKTEQFDDAVWSKVNTAVLANTVIAPDGTLTGDKLASNTAGVFSHQCYKIGITITNAATYTWSVYMKQGEYTWGIVNAYSATDTRTYFNLATGTVGTVAANSTATITPVGDGWYRCSVTQTSGAATGGLSVEMTNADNNPVFAAAVNSGIYIWGASLVVTAQAPAAYQRVNTSTDYDTVGFKPYLLADGVDDGMVTNSIDFTATDKMTVCAGVRKLSDAARGMLLECGLSINTFRIEAPVSASSTYTFASGGSALAAADAAGYSAPITNVVSGIGNISAPAATIRINGAQIATNSATQGTGNYGNAPLYLFRRGGATLPFNGRFYGMTVVGKAVTAGELASLEAYTNSKTGAFV